MHPISDPSAYGLVSLRQDLDFTLYRGRQKGDPSLILAALLFEPFYTTKPDGLGIGLSISRSIVEAHGGRLTAGANAPYGAVFFIWLPLEEQAP